MSRAPKQLSLFDATLLVMGGIIGVGIFFMPGKVAALLPEAGPYFGMWILGALAALAGAMTFAELAGTLPKSGGWFVFIHTGFGPLAAFLFAWIVLLVISTGACAIVADFCAQQWWTLLAPEHEPSFAERRGLAGALILGVSACAWRGMRSGVLLQNLCMLAKLVALAVFIIAGLAFFQGPALQPLPSSVPATPLAGRMISATLPVLFTFGGWQLITYIAPHVKDAPRNLPRAIIMGVVGVSVVYLALNAAYVRVLGMGGLADSANAPAELALITLGPGGQAFLTAAMGVSALGFLVATLVTTPGIYVAMARMGLFFQAAGRVHAASGAPRVALTIQAGLCCVYLCVSADVIDRLGHSVVFAEWIFHGLTGLALLRLRRLRPDLPRPFRSPLYPLFPLLYVLMASGVVLGNLLTSPTGVTGLGLGLLALGALVYLPWRRMFVGQVAPPDGGPR